MAGAMAHIGTGGVMCFASGKFKDLQLLTIASNIEVQLIPHLEAFVKKTQYVRQCGYIGAFEVGKLPPLRWGDDMVPEDIVSLQVSPLFR